MTGGTVIARAVFVPRAPTLSGVPDKKPAGTVTLPGDALVIRFRPTDPDRVLKKAGDESRRTGRHGASVFAAVGEPGETDVALKRRLLAVADLSGMKPEDHPKFYVCTRADELYRRGFVFYRTGMMMRWTSTTLWISEQTLYAKML